MATFDDISLTIEDGLATITLKRPERLNALSTNLKRELLEAVRQVGRPRSGVRCLMIRGEGRAFSAGADLAEGGLGAGSDPGANLMDTYQALFTELAALPVPIITAVNGLAAGAGMSLALAGDIVIASKSAYFLQAFVNIGLVPDAGSTFVLPRLIGNARARAMMMLGEKIPAETAHEWGMIYAVADDETFAEEATVLANKLAKGPTIALSEIRQLVAASADNGFAAQFQAEAMAQRKAGQTHDCVEGVSAFLQKREANFKGE